MNSEEEHWRYADYLPRPVEYPSDSEQLVEEGRDYVQIVFGVALWVLVVALAVWGHHAVSWGMLP